MNICSGFLKQLGFSENEHLPGLFSSRPTVAAKHTLLNIPLQ